MRLATASSDGTTKVWVLFEGGGRELMTLTADDTRSGFADVAFSAGRHPHRHEHARAAPRSSGAPALDATAEVASLPGPAFGPGEVRFTDDGRHLLATGGGGTVDVWNVGTWQRVRELGARWRPHRRRHRSASRCYTARRRAARPESRRPARRRHLPRRRSPAPTEPCPSTTSTADRTASRSTSAPGERRRLEHRRRAPRNRRCRP